MKISDTTKSVLKNFADINQNLLVQPGQELKTISTMKNILAKAKIEEEFTSEFGIYDLSEFLGVLSLFKRPTFSFEEKNIGIAEDGTSTKTNYFFSDPAVLVTPQKDIKMPECEVNFVLTHADLANVKKAAAVMQLPDISVHSDTGDIMLTATDKKNDTSNNYSVKVGDNAEHKFDFHFKTENLKLIEGDYDVAISSKNISHFKHKSKEIEYWIALEQTSTFN
tara:strand:+ start:297 stop:965 length:669 start_codon:yes stop_codon:yes gene_type:complete